MENVTPKNEKSISGAIKIDKKEIGDHLNQLVRQSVEDTINSLLDAEAITSGKLRTFSERGLEKSLFL